MLMCNRLRSVNVYRSEKQSTGYVGSTLSWILHGAVRADVQSTDSRTAIAEYGERVSGMKTLYLPRGEDISLGDGVFSLDSDGFPTYRIVSLLEYSNHIVAVAEKAAV